MAGPFDERDRSRIKYHLGYLAVQPAASIQFGIPRPIETLFLVEDAMNNIVNDGFNVQNVLRLLGVLDNIECRMQGSLDYLPANKLGTLEVRSDMMDAFEREYNRWAQRIADILGVPMYPYSQRAKEAAGVMGGNIPVRRR